MKEVFEERYEHGRDLAILYFLGQNQVLVILQIKICKDLAREK